MISLLRKKAAFEMGFNWIFAILAGGFILFIAIYAASNLIKTGNQVTQTEKAASFTAVLDPYETGLASGKSSEINFNKETRLYFDCSHKTHPPFGSMWFSSSEVLFEEYNSYGVNTTTINKYVFVEKITEGKKFVAFSKPFFLPFKIADIIVISATNYCFYDTPEEVIDDIGGLNLPNIQFVNGSIKCSGIKVCFDDKKSDNCEVKVAYKEKYVQRYGKRMYFEGSLLYGAIFSSPDIYECNVKRLMNKFVELGGIYNEKIKIIERKECDPKIGTKLSLMISRAGNITSSKNLRDLAQNSNEIDSINENGKSGCKVY
jgi:hypothetical protein